MVKYAYTIAALAALATAAPTYLAAGSNAEVSGSISRRTFGGLGAGAGGNAGAGVGGNAGLGGSAGLGANLGLGGNLGAGLGGAFSHHEVLTASCWRDGASE